MTVSGLFKPLPVRRKELERNAKREFGKALTLLHAYALVPCAKENKGVRLSVTNHPKGGYVHYALCSVTQAERVGVGRRAASCERTARLRRGLRCPRSGARRRWTTS